MIQTLRLGGAARRALTSLAVALATSLTIGAVASHAQTSTDLTAYTHWDALHRPTMKVGPDPDGAGPLKRRVEKYTYDLDGQLIRTDLGAASTITGSDFVARQSTLMRYDAVGNRTQVYAGAGTAGATLTQISYDAADRPLCTAVRMNSAVFDILFNETASPDACALRAVGAQGPDRITKTVYDAAGQTRQTIQALGTADQRTYATYGYTANGKPATIKDARNNLTSLRYDGFDRLCRQELPAVTVSSAASNGPSAPQGAAYLPCRANLADAKTSTSGDFEEYGYDVNGNKIWQRKRDNGGLSFTYDALNRQIAKSGDNIPGVDTAYDLAGKPSSALFSSGPNAGRGVTYTYDTAGRPIGEATFDRAMGSGYDAAGNRTRMTWPDGNYVTYAVDNASQPKTLAVTTGAPFLTYGYDDLGRRVLASYGSGAANAFGYDEVSRLRTWSLDLAGTDKDLSETFTYNAAGQVVSRAATNGAYLWRTTTTSVAATADGLNRDQAIATIGGGGCAASGKGYDCTGNLTNDGTRSLTYDGENRLVLMSGSVAASLEYDPLGRLTRTTIGGTVTQFLYDGDQLVAEYDGAGNLLRRYAHGAGTDDPVMWWEGAGFGQPRSLHADRQGSIIAWSDASGANQAIYTYGPYGEPGDNWAAGSRFRYTGQAALPELKLYHYKARVYDPMRGWFLQTDPIGYDDGLNMYAYVGNDPLNGSDPTGTSSQDIQIAKVRAAAFLRGFAKEGVDTVGGLAKVGGIWTPDVTGQRGRTIDSQVAWVNSKLGEPNSSATQKAEVLGRAAFFGLGLLTGSAEAKGTTTLYRAVGPEEAAQIMKTGTFGVGPNSLGGKWFAESLGDAQRWGKLFGGDFSVMSVRLPTSDANSLMRVERLDGVGPARYGEIDQLRRAKIEPVN